MTTAEKIDRYLDRALAYLNTPCGQRDPAEYEAILAEKAEVVAESQKFLKGA